jgi:hypothetical protein
VLEVRLSVAGVDTLLLLPVDGPLSVVMVYEDLEFGWDSSNSLTKVADASVLDFFFGHAPILPKIPFDFPEDPVLGADTTSDIDPGRLLPGKDGGICF